jgi:hypothetical protein
MAKETPLKFKFIGAEVLRFQDNSAVTLREDVPLEYAFNFGLGFEAEANALAISVVIGAFPKAAPHPQGGAEEGVASPEEETTEMSATESAVEVEFRAVYEVEGLQERAEASRGKVPRPLLAHLIGMTISAARGSIVALGQSPALRRAPVPVMTPQNFVDHLAESTGFDWIDSAPALAARGADAESQGVEERGD